MIELRARRDTPEANGLYLVLQRGANTPQVVWWTERSRFWLHGARRIEVTHWDGPIRMPHEQTEVFL